MTEEWRPVACSGGKYQVSNLGQVKSPTGKILKHYLTPDGYHDVNLYVNSKEFQRKVHRLVAEAFLPEDYAPYPEKEVNHKDGNKDNNCVDNLEMVTHQGNMDHYWRDPVFAEQQKKYSAYAKDAMTARWENDEFRNKVQAIFDSPEYKKAHSEAGKKVYEDPEMRKKAGERSKKMWSAEGFHDKQVEAIKQGWSDPAKRQAAKQRMSNMTYMHTPEGKNVRIHSSEVNQKLAEGYKLGRISYTSKRCIPVYCRETDTVYATMSACDRALGLKIGDTYNILNGSKIKRLQQLKEKYHIDYATDKQSQGRTSW